MDAAAVAERLRQIEGVAQHAGLGDLGAAAFAYAAALLEEDEHLTRLGNPTSDARSKLRDRIEELLIALDSATEREGASSE